MGLAPQPSICTLYQLFAPATPRSGRLCLGNVHKHGLWPWPPPETLFFVCFLLPFTCDLLLPGGQPRCPHWPWSPEVTNGQVSDRQPDAPAFSLVSETTLFWLWHLCWGLIYFLLDLLCRLSLWHSPCICPWPDAPCVCVCVCVCVTEGSTLHVLSCSVSLYLAISPGIPLCQFVELFITCLLAPWCCIVWLNHCSLS